MANCESYYYTDRHVRQKLAHDVDPGGHWSIIWHRKSRPAAPAVARRDVTVRSTSDLSRDEGGGGGATDANYVTDPDLPSSGQTQAIPRFNLT